MTDLIEFMFAWGASTASCFKTRRAQHDQSAIKKWAVLVTENDLDGERSWLVGDSDLITQNGVVRHPQPSKGILSA